MGNNLEITLCSEPDSIPFDLLLVADPSQKVIDKYLPSSDVYLAKLDRLLVGVLILRTSDNESEIMNVAVKEQYRGKGIGSKLIRFAIQKAKAFGLTKLAIGTADTSSDQLSLYQKLGFSITGRIKNFFVEHYPAPIYENGKQAKDMIRLEMSLS